jgi:hypothetical protein
MVFILIMIFLCEISGSHGGRMKIRVSWDMALCSLRVDRGFGGTLQKGLMYLFCGFHLI